MKAAPPPPHRDQLIFVRRENLPGKNCWLTYFQIHVGEIVEIGGVIDGFDEDRDGGGSLPDVGPVDAVEPVQHLHILDRLDSQLHVVAESTHKKRDRMSK